MRLLSRYASVWPIMPGLLLFCVSGCCDFDAQYSGSLTTGAGGTCNLVMSIQDEPGSAPKNVLVCTDARIGDVLNMILENGVRVAYDEIAFRHTATELNSSVCSTVRLKGCECPPTGGHFKKVVGAIDRCIANQEAGIETFCIPFMEIATDLTKGND